MRVSYSNLMNALTPELDNAIDISSNRSYLDIFLIFVSS